MNELACFLGVTEELAFHDVYSLYDDDAMAMVPRPVFALLVTIPMMEAWKQHRDAEDGAVEWYKGVGRDESVTWFQQTVIHGCRLIGFLHCVANGLPSEMVVPGSELANLLEKAIPPGIGERAALLNDTNSMHKASETVAQRGDTKDLYAGEESIHLFVVLIKGSLEDDEDAFSELALELGTRRLIDI
ncbi:ubiquitin carboxyl-terminal hydrolase-like protein isozyme L3 [Dactylonectria macrodidyma]|uniref:Ubiquitin carboxyl-terminal hydrolase n=1 Tax=Dactylonectria macrodidyma TaxID=307937 RepID=A0A9P9JNF4_9HYPO|nr:ubiquitin carboxyl-terminal hydrolase-like protein isozyme L3 [Dactylonectria macrodidyma]